MKRLREKKGETLVECLMSILIVGLAVSIFAGCVMMSEHLVFRAKKHRERYYQEMSFLEALEQQEIPGDVVQETGEAVLTISVKQRGDGYRKVEELPIILYYGEHMAAYERNCD